MNDQMAAAAASTGDAHELFALSDEQILEITPEANAPADARQVAGVRPSAHPPKTNGQPEHTADPSLRSAPATSRTNHESPVTSHDTAEPPPWLAAQMKDPWGGEEAREFWDGVQQARSEAAAYRAAFASPEDARALKELYPGGVNEARATAERARLLEDIDRAYFGAAGNSPEQLTASRAQLAQRMLQEDPAAFREMVAAGLQALQEAEQGSSGAASQANLPRLAQIFSESRSNREVASRFGIETSSAAGSQQTPSDAGLKSGASSQSSHVGAQHAAPLPGSALANEAHTAAYAAFERAANEDLERSVGGAIERTLTQALPNVELHNTPGQAGAQRAAPLRDRLAASVRAEVEKALQGDRQLGEQVAQILSSRRFDNDTRAQIVRLISDRAQQLVPGAAKRVLNEWTQTTLAAHRGRTQRPDPPPVADVALASVPARPAGTEQRPARRQDASRSSGQASAIKSQPINYRKLTDEQILDM